jgi:hypothetical protein
MIKKDTLTKVLAFIGICLVWLPIFGTVITSIFGTISSGRFRFDYLLPAELGLFFLVGGLLLIWAAISAKIMRQQIIWGLVIPIALLIGSQLFAVLTGIASGEYDAVGWRWLVVMIPLIGYSLGIIVEGIFGIKLLRQLVKINRIGDIYDDQQH